MNKGPERVAVIWILGGLAMWSSALSISMFNDHASLATITQSVLDIKDSINNKVIPALPHYSHNPISNYYASTTTVGE